MYQPNTSKRMRTITLEEHYATPAFVEGPGRELSPTRAPPEMPTIMNRWLDQLCDLDKGRIADMDAAAIDVQVLSLTSPGVEQLETAEAVTFAREANDHLAGAVRRHPARFAGFATLPSAAPATAADELERAIHELGFKGGWINGHVRGRYLDDPFFWPIFERAEALEVPLCLHPTGPPEAVIKASYTGNFSPVVTRALAMPAWGWHIETATHVLRIILAGVFDRYPRLQLIVGHLGETLPFMLARFDDRLPQQMTTLSRPIGAYLRENLHYTFSGFNYLPSFLNLFFEVGVSRIMFSTDYPYGSMTKARTFLDSLPVSPADKEQIAHGNAERLLGM
jgi:predicted TIM-barrel fold metal-dependent hydrolase